MSISHADPGAVIYARALMEAVESDGGLEALREAGEAVEAVSTAWTENRTLRAYFLASEVPSAVQATSLDRLVNGLPKLVANFLRLLMKRDRLSLLSDIGLAFRGLLDEKLGRVPVTITTAVPIDDVSLHNWSQRIREAVGGEPVISHEVKPELLAGAVIRVGDQVADGSARRQLAALKNRIIEKGLQRHGLQP